MFFVPIEKTLAGDNGILLELDKTYDAILCILRSENGSSYCYAILKGDGIDRYDELAQNESVTVWYDRLDTREVFGPNMDISGDNGYFGTSLIVYGTFREAMNAWQNYCL